MDVGLAHAENKTVAHVAAAERMVQSVTVDVAAMVAAQMHSSHVSCNWFIVIVAVDQL